MIWTETWGQRPLATRSTPPPSAGIPMRCGDPFPVNAGSSPMCSPPSSSAGTCRSTSSSPMFARGAGRRPPPAGRLRRGDGGHQRHHPAVDPHQLPHLRLARGDVLTGMSPFGGSPRGDERWPDEAQPCARPRVTMPSGVHRFSDRPGGLPMGHRSTMCSRSSRRGSHWRSWSRRRSSGFAFHAFTQARISVRVVARRWRRVCRGSRLGPESTRTRSHVSLGGSDARRVGAQTPAT